MANCILHSVCSGWMSGKLYSAFCVLRLDEWQTVFCILCAQLDEWQTVFCILCAQAG